jgi:hypothetical protein
MQNEELRPLSLVLLTPFGRVTIEEMGTEEAQEDWHRDQMRHEVGDAPSVVRDESSNATAQRLMPIEARRDDPTFAAFGAELLALVRVVLREAEQEVAGHDGARAGALGRGLVR